MQSATKPASGAPLYFNASRPSEPNSTYNDQTKLKPQKALKNVYQSSAEPNTGGLASNAHE